jgi:hypothetical protein
MSTLRPETPLFAGRHIPRAAVAGISGQISANARRVVGEMKRAIAREEQERRNQDRFASTIVIAAAIIAAVRLARDDISSPSPRVYAAVADSVSLARKILQRVIG